MRIIHIKRTVRTWPDLIFKSTIRFELQILLSSLFHSKRVDGKKIVPEVFMFNIK